MIHTHPFAARMAPEIALGSLSSLSTHSIVLDPMCGSGMVLSQAAKAGITSIGCDLDPLARLISRVGSTRVRESAVWQAFDFLMQYCARNDARVAKLAWIDKDQETLDFVRYWFAPNQERQLRRISKFLDKNNSNFRSVPLNVLAIALSRMIITKEPKASLARDTAHSRPHRTILENDYDIYANFEKSVSHVLKALNSAKIKTNSTTYLSDARKMGRVKSNSVDAIITSPPYLNAIDYMRGHKFSLIWFGFRLSELRSIRGRTIGSEAAASNGNPSEFNAVVKRLGLSDLSKRNFGMLNRYYLDLSAQLRESSRVLKRGGSALYVIGNSSIKGHHVRNSEILKLVATKSGFSLVSETTREIPDNRRYMPVSVDASNALARRMRTEHVLNFAI